MTNHQKMIISEVKNIDAQTKVLVDLLKELKDNYDVCLFDKKISKFKQNKQKMFIGSINNLNHIIKCLRK